MTHISESMSSIQNSAASLNDLVARANVPIRHVDKFLKDVKPGIRVLCPEWFYRTRLKNSNGDRVIAGFRLAYARDDDEDDFNLVVIAEALKTETDERGETHFVPPLLGSSYDADVEVLWTRKLEKQSRDLKIEAIKHLPQLLQMLSEELVSVNEERKKSLDHIDVAFGGLKLSSAPQQDHANVTVPPVPPTSEQRRPTPRRPESRIQGPRTDTLQAVPTDIEMRIAAGTQSVAVATHSEMRIASPVQYLATADTRAVAATESNLKMAARTQRAAAAPASKRL